jgi:hypothetical protein
MAASPPSAHALAFHTRGLIRPRYAVLARPVTALRIGDIMVEPALGEVRVGGIVHHRRWWQLSWTAADGRTGATLSVPARALVDVRIPHRADIRRITWSINVATWHDRELDVFAARLIAAHLQAGPGSALYAFAAKGMVSDALYEELDRVPGRDRPLLARWTNVLANHCLNRVDHRRPVWRQALAR